LQWSTVDSASFSNFPSTLPPSFHLTSSTSAQSFPLVGPENAAPEYLWGLCVEGHRVLGHFGANLLVGADEVEGPREVAKVGHEPDLGVNREAGEAPRDLVPVGEGSRGFGWAPICWGVGHGLVFDGAVFDDEGKFDVWDELGAGGNGAVDLLEDGQCAGRVVYAYELRL
jgi:hypothetical protein